MKYPVQVWANNPTVVQSKNGSKPLASQEFKAWIKANKIPYHVTNGGYQLANRNTPQARFFVTWYFDNPDHAMLFKLAWV